MPRTPQYFTTEPKIIALDVLGPFIRLGKTTFIRYDQICGLQTVEVPIWSPPPAAPAPPPAVEIEIVEGDPDDDVDVVVEEPKPPEGAPPAPASPPADAPRVTMTRIYLQSEYGSLLVDTPDGKYTSTPVVRHTVEEVYAAIQEATSNKAHLEAKIMSGMITAQIEEDTGIPVEDISHRQV